MPKFVNHRLFGNPAKKDNPPAGPGRPSRAIDFYKINEAGDATYDELLLWEADALERTVGESRVYPVCPIARQLTYLTELIQLNLATCPSAF
jgi:hypothetical protein